jgi:hypothetical protein
MIDLAPNEKFSMFAVADAAVDPSMDDPTQVSEQYSASVAWD